MVRAKRDPLRAAERRIEAAIYVPVGTLAVEAWVTPEPVPFGRRRDGRAVTLAPGEAWSAATFDCAWFHFTGTVPAAAAGHEVVLLIDVGGEACVVDAAGDPALGLTNIASGFARDLGEPGKRVVPFLARAAGGEPVALWADAGANDLFGVRRDGGVLQEAAIAIRRPTVHALYYDFAVLRELIEQLPPDSARAEKIRAALNQAAARLGACGEDEAAAARAILAPALARPARDPTLTISAVGHAHMDLAWLWPIRETIRKCARTFATVLALMERYPDYVFGASQPQQYDWVKRHYPALYARIKQRVAEGRWEVQGAMWVEADLNLSGGEALVRQLLYGKRFFRDEFGIEPDCLWEPDVFGCSGAVPQLLAKSGVDCFMTQKLSWNWVTRHPHHTFWWQGIDGSRVLAHMPPEDTYNSSAAPRALHAAATRFIDKAVSDRALMLFGIGDGGGGPGEEHLERLAREKSLDGVPPAVQETAASFFTRIRRGADRYATWRGELYLERHQGTYTTQARVKRANRRLELALRELELAAAFADAPYPAALLEAIWKEALLYQFHDILPGSSIGRVYDECLPRYDALAQEVAALTAAADRTLLRQVGAGSAMRQPLVVLNSLGWERSEWLHAGTGWIAATAPPLGLAVVDAAAAQSFVPPAANSRLLENEFLRLRFHRDGSILSCFDKKQQREVLAPGARGNRLALWRDPGDAWDIAMDYRTRRPRHFKLLASEASLDGPRAALRQTYRFGRSELRQEIVLFAGRRRVDFVTALDWHESGLMLRTSFPVAVAAREASCGIQFGTIRRPTHADTQADAAKFEVAAHKWVDLSDGERGVALLDDCKYGHHLRGNLIDLNLMRSTGYPDSQADRGRHDFTYALYPHAGDHAAGAVVREAYALNCPLRPIGAPERGGGPERISWLAPSAAHVVIETVKRAEDGRGVIVRLYESAGAAASCALGCGFALGAAWLTDLMERDRAALPLGESGVQVKFRPYEIHTLRLVAA